MRIIIGYPSLSIFDFFFEIALSLQYGWFIKTGTVKEETFWKHREIKFVNKYAYHDYNRAIKRHRREQKGFANGTPAYSARHRTLAYLKAREEYRCRF
ncbi:MAG: hypothetical protein EZS28_036128 [Streblomastix strix]|uniref:Uncharacterized protein n=1 Tax=Streblomastix strix TaxID=222440 RepID=A0A5J4UFL0_9EUKA|nr:MAG: hypothetical protein EZS28_036128 [Streblomastix strix]